MRLSGIFCGILSACFYLFLYFIFDSSLISGYEVSFKSCSRFISIRWAENRRGWYIQTTNMLVKDSKHHASYHMSPHTMERLLFERAVIFSWLGSTILCDLYHKRLSSGCGNTLYYRENCFLMAHSSSLDGCGYKARCFLLQSFFLGGIWRFYNHFYSLGFIWVRGCSPILIIDLNKTVWLTSYFIFLVVKCKLDHKGTILEFVRSRPSLIYTW